MFSPRRNAVVVSEPSLMNDLVTAASKSRCRAATLVMAAVLMVSAASAQDVLTVGSGSLAPGGIAQIPVFVRDLSGSPLGSDAGSGNRIQGIAFKVSYSPSNLVTAIAFVRAGVTQSRTPLYETTITSTAAIAYLGSFAEATNPLLFGLNASAPGDRIGTLQVSVSASAVPLNSITLAIDPVTVTLSNQTGTVVETTANGGLTVQNGSITVTAPPDAPSGVTASAVSESEVAVFWSAVNGADHFDVFRSSNGSSYELAGSAAATTYNDVGLAADTTYLYFVRAVDAGGSPSANSAIDPATTILFTDDPAGQDTRIKAVHLTELRTAVNAFRASASLGPASFTDTSLVDVPIRAVHIEELRTALDAARTSLSLPPVTYTDPTLTPGPTLVRAAHVQDLRGAVK